jgi:hypothetical protein
VSELIERLEKNDISIMGYGPVGLVRQGYSLPQSAVRDCSSELNIHFLFAERTKSARVP